MPEKFPQYVFAEYSIFRKLVCLLLGITLLTVQSGCYTMRVTQSFDQVDIHSVQKIQNLETGQLVRIIYKEETSNRRIEGTIQSLDKQAIVITQRQPGKNVTQNVTISIKQIQKIDSLDKQLDPVASILGGTLGALGIWVIIGLVTLPSRLGD